MNRALLGTDFPNPDFQSAKGRFVTLERLDWARHLDGLFACLGGDDNQDIWRWLGNSGPYGDEERDKFTAEFAAAQVSEKLPWQTVVIRDATLDTVVGMASLMRIRPNAGSMEVGFIAYSHHLQRTPQATEAMYLLMRYCFEDLGYRRYEWKCNDRNKPSMRAAQRLGFTYEGTFRQDQIAKGENRDTAWFSMLDHEWPTIGAAFEAWLSQENFDAAGQQRTKLEDIRTSLNSSKSG
ncbi:MAG: GNAT family protein [Pseudomonadota bacterium]